MPTHPYQDLADPYFWKSGVVEASPFEMQALYEPKFGILPSERIATAGSCFAQHISREVKSRGYAYLDVEPAPPWLDATSQARFGYGLYSARYGNIYTMAQLTQLAQEAAGLLEPHAQCWAGKAAYFDPLRPGVEPEGLDTPAEVAAHRRFHISRVRTLLSEMDVFIFTLGLTEAWRDRSGRVFPTAPGVLAGAFSAEEFEYVNFDFRSTVAAFHDFVAALKVLRAGAPPKIILTVSPVPLTATASGRHVLQATTYSKSVLRAVAGELAATVSFVDYFPSYEVITNPAARGVFYDSNLRSVSKTGVDTAMRLFFSQHRLQSDAEPAPVADLASTAGSTASPPGADQAKAMAVQCEEAVLEAFGR